ncbi:Virulence protein RhuM family protein [Fibrobacter sp. UWH9]|nr:RhuM family protein [Fibrobacter sp. UWH9]SHH44324.1 Virulence protein RhuM family protein [Fibrobacter sp. UWH9]
MENQPEKAPEKGEIIAYHADGELHLDVRLENETVWLTQAQIAELFGTKRPAITKHLKNIYASQELDEHSTCSVLEHMGNASQQVYETKYYNLDAILSVGYRVNSKNATLFRRWANQVLKNHLLKGYSINQRLMLSEQRIDQQLVNHENHLQSHDNRLDALEKQVDFFVKLNTPPTEGAIPAKSWWCGYEFAAQLVRSAKQEIIIIDPYADDRTLRLPAKSIKPSKPHRTGPEYSRCSRPFYHRRRHSLSRRSIHKGFGQQIDRIFCFRIFDERAIAEHDSSTINLICRGRCGGAPPP